MFERGQSYTLTEIRKGCSYLRRRRRENPPTKKFWLLCKIGVHKWGEDGYFSYYCLRCGEDKDKNTDITLDIS